MLYADDAGVVSKSADGLARMMTIIVEVFREFGLTVSERKTETLVMRVKEKQPSPPPSPPPPPPLIIEAAGQRYAQTTSDTWAASSTSRATSTERSTTGAKQRGRASGGMPRSSSTGRERRFDSRPAYSRQRR